MTDLLVEHFPRVMDLKFTSHMEEELDEIENGKTQYEQVLDEFWGPFSTALNDGRREDAEAARASRRARSARSAASRWSSNYSKKTGREFIGCSGCAQGEPCKYIKPGEGEAERPEPVETEHKCPTCGKPMIAANGQERHVPRLQRLSRVQDDDELRRRRASRCWRRSRRSTCARSAASRW